MTQAVIGNQSGDDGDEFSGVSIMCPPGPRQLTWSPPAKAMPPWRAKQSDGPESPV
jgi:hypothetical protein